MGSPELDELDRQVVHALYLAPRAPFRQIGAALGVADQTVARRYRALRAKAGLRVTGCVDGRRLGWSDWMLRLQCTPDIAGGVAAALARRPDTSWVRLASGGTEVHCVTTAASHDWDALLLDRLAGSRRVVGVSAYSVLHVFAGRTTGWLQAMEALSADQIARLALSADQTTRLTPSAGQTAQPTPGAQLAPAAAASDEPLAPPLSATDRTLLEVLGRDGRASHAKLAAAAGWHESTARRRVEALQASGVLYFDVDIDEVAFGVQARALLWLSVAPSRLAAVGEAMASHREAPFVAATSGPTNLLASVVCADGQALYRYLSERVGGLEGALRVETSPIVRTFKRTGQLPAAGS